MLKLCGVATDTRPYHGLTYENPVSPLPPLKFIKSMSLLLLNRTQAVSFGLVFDKFILYHLWIAQCSQLIDQKTIIPLKVIKLLQ